MKNEMLARARRRLFLLCFLVYSAAYVGRYNFSPAIPAMAEAGFDREALGLYGTGFLLCYGLGQAVSGYLGDKLPARRLIAAGLLGSGLSNLLMGALPPGWQWIWCANGLFQSMLWSPITRLLADWLPEEARKKAMIRLSYSFAAGALLAYGLSALLLRLFSWQSVFYVAALCLLLCGAVWALQVGRIEARHAREKPALRPAAGAGAAPLSLWRVVLLSGLLVVGLALMCDGMLKDGASMWIPTYLSEQFGLATADAALATTVMPLLNMLGVFLTERLTRLFRDEMRAAAALFGLAALSFLLLTLLPNHLLWALPLLGLAMMSALGINTLLVSVVPMYFVPLGRTSTITGLLNTCMHLTSSVSSYAIAALSLAFGWKLTVLSWAATALLGLLCALAVRRRFFGFVRNLEGGALFPNAKHET